MLDEKQQEHYQSWKVAPSS